MEKYTAEMHEEYVQAETERKAAEEQDRREKVEKETAKQAWLRDGGRAEDFERAWPSLRDDARRERVKDADRQARQAMRNSAGSRL